MGGVWGFIGPPSLSKDDHTTLRQEIMTRVYSVAGYLRIAARVMRANRIRHAPHYMQPMEKDDCIPRAGYVSVCGERRRGFYVVRSSISAGRMYAMTLLGTMHRRAACL